MNLDGLIQLLERCDVKEVENKKEEIILEFDRIKKKLLDLNDQLNLKELWFYRQVFKIQELYIRAYKEMKKESYYTAWCTLEKCEIALVHLSYHFKIDNRFKLDFISKHVHRFQAIFPYKLFFSPEIIEKEKKCTICNKVVTIRNPCGHNIGEIYNGEMCGRKITKADFIGVAFVKKPFQKYSVPFLESDKLGKPIDHYNYKLVEYVIKRLDSPFNERNYEWTKIRHPKPEEYIEIGRNDRCPCGSGKKYKKCCYEDIEGLKDHCIIHFSVAPPDDMVGIVYD